MEHINNIWYKLSPDLQDTLAVAALDYLKQGLLLTPTQDEFERWRGGLSAFQQAHTQGLLAETWASLPLFVDFLAEQPTPGKPSLPASWLREALPNVFNMTFSFHRYLLEVRDYSMHEFMLSRLSEADYLVWLQVRWPVALV